MNTPMVKKTQTKPRTRNKSLLASVKPSAEIVFSKINGLLLFFVVYFTYLLTVYPTVQTEDSGELIVSALAPDVAHPPGYPLYTLVGKLFSVIAPFGNPAWRINVMSAAFGAATAHLLYVIIKKRTGNDLIAFGMGLFYAFTNIVWGQSNRAEVYTLNTFALVLIIYLIMRWHDAQPGTGKTMASKKNRSARWLFLTALTFGLGVGNHHLLLLAAPAMGIYVLVKNWKTVINPKIVFGSLALLLLGLSVYAYIPIRTFVGPYDNPAYIDHSGLYTWEKFIGFVNRKIYGGTVNIPGDQATQEAAAAQLPAWLVGIKDFFADYGGRFVAYNAEGLPALLKIISSQYLYLPLFFILPGLYFLFKKDKTWAAFITLLFFCYTMVLLVFTPINGDTGDYVAFTTEPFMMPALIVLAVIMGEGLAWLHKNITHKKAALVMSIVCLLPAGLALAKNFPLNNESRNYLAYDFNKLALESVPPNGYLLSTGRDNMTFPLYYLRKIENVRPDVELEIYYSTSPVDEVVLLNRSAERDGQPVFIDLLPQNYATMDIKPYNFVYVFGAGNGPTTASATVTKNILPPEHIIHPVVRGIRSVMDFPNTRLKMLYFIKTGIMEKDPALKKTAFDRVINTEGVTDFYLNIVGDYAYSIRDFETAKKAYEKSGNSYGLEKVTDTLNNPNHTEDMFFQTGMS